MSLEKAQLKCHDSAKNIEFMFNPKELAFKFEVETADNSGARSEKTGRPKISFSNLPPKIITISNILFDTYETRENVIEKYIKPFQQATNFVEDSKEVQRPPLYSFMWGITYLDYCFIEDVSYKLTKFLSDGTPVRAVIDSLTLKETEKPKDASSNPKAKPAPQSDNVKTRGKKNK